MKTQEASRKKKHLKIIFFAVQPFIVKMQFKIYKYLLLFVRRLKYLMCCFAASVQLVPKFYSHPPCSLLELKLMIFRIIHLQLAVINLSRNI